MHSSEKTVECNQSVNVSESAKQFLKVRHSIYLYMRWSKMWALACILHIEKLVDLTL